MRTIHKIGIGSNIHGDGLGFGVVGFEEFIDVYESFAKFGISEIFVDHELLDVVEYIVSLAEF